MKIDFPGGGGQPDRRTPVLKPGQIHKVHILNRRGNTALLFFKGQMLTALLDTGDITSGSFKVRIAGYEDGRPVMRVVERLTNPEEVEQAERKALEFIMARSTERKQGSSMVEDFSVIRDYYRGTLQLGDMLSETIFKGLILDCGPGEEHDQVSLLFERLLWSMTYIFADCGEVDSTGNEGNEEKDTPFLARLFRLAKLNESAENREGTWIQRFYLQLPCSLFADQTLEMMVESFGDPLRWGPQEKKAPKERGRRGMLFRVTLRGKTSRLGPYEVVLTMSSETLECRFWVSDKDAEKLIGDHGVRLQKCLEGLGFERVCFETGTRSAGDLAGRLIQPEDEKSLSKLDLFI